MLRETRSIYFMTELRFLPIEELQFGKNFVRDLYMELAKPGGYPFENLQIQADPPAMFTKRPTQNGDGVSACKIGPDTLMVEETEPEVSVDHFTDNLATILNSFKEVRGKDPTAPIFAQRCVIRCVVKPGVSKNAINLLAGKVSNVLDSIQPFERPPQFFGVRFRFPPFDFVDDESDGTEVEEENSFVTIRFETWSKDVDFIWMEIDARYIYQEPVSVSQVKEICNNVIDANQFLTEKCVRFLNQFDDKPDPIDDDSDEPDEETGDEDE